MAGDNNQDIPQLGVEASQGFANLNYVDLLKNAERVQPGERPEDLLHSLAFSEQTFSSKMGTGFLTSPVSLEVNKTAFLNKSTVQPLGAQFRIGNKALI